MTVQELVTGKLLRMLAGSVPVMTGLEAVNSAVNVIGLELVRRKSDLAQEEISLSYAQGTASKTLPDGFMGFVGHPVVVDGYELVAGPDLATETELSGQIGKPRYYNLWADQLYLYPLPATACTVKATAKIVPVLELADDLPWLGLFDNLIATGAMQLSVHGYGLLSSPAFLAMIDKGISAVLVPRMNELPRVRPINYF